jgi:hypothetical protein
MLTPEEIIMSETKTPFAIEKGIAMPFRQRLPEMPLAEMNVGDSFLIENLADNPADVTAVRQRIFRFHKANPNVRLSLVRDNEVDGAMRLFRLQDRDHE